VTRTTDPVESEDGADAETMGDDGVGMVDRGDSVTVTTMVDALLSGADRLAPDD
jgi:hypothetical protein